jgi:ABC-type multidrug transport system fused ATPase/permease subunit
MSTALPGGSHLPVAGPGQALRAAARLVRADRHAFAVMLSVNCLAAVAGLAGPWLLGRMIDDIQDRSGAGAGAGAVDWLAATALGIAVALIPLRRLGAYLGSRFGERVQARLREQFADWVLGLPPAVVERTDTGDLVARGTGDITVIGVTLRDVTPAMLIAALQVVFIVAAAIAVSPPLGICGLVGLVGMRIVLRWYLRRARAAYLDAGAATSLLAGQLVASAAGARTIEALGLQERRRDACAEAIAGVRRTQYRTLSLRTVLYPSIDISCVIPAVLVLIFGMVLVGHDAASLGSVVTVALYMQQLAQPIASALEWIDHAQGSGASFARVEGVGRAVPDRPALCSMRVPASDLIEVSKVCYAYDPDDGDVLSDVTLTVQPGERLALVGPSGAGKTTLARLLAGTDWPRAGTITVGGVPVAELSPEQLREQVQFITQDQHLFRGTVRDNLRLGSPAASDADLHSALDTVQADWVGGLPDGLDTEIGAGRLPVTEAQLQQLALARVVLADPHTLVLDEATAQLDPRSARRAEQALAALLTGRTIITVAQRLQTALDADRVAIMSGGQIVEIGSHEELLRHDGPYAALWRSWQGEASPDGSGDASPGQG